MTHNEVLTMAPFTSPNVVIMSYVLPIVEEDNFLQTDFPKIFDPLEIVQTNGSLEVFVLQTYCDANTRNYNEIMRATTFVWRSPKSKQTVPEDVLYMGMWRAPYLSTDKWNMLFMVNPDPAMKASAPPSLKKLEADVGAVKRNLSTLQATVRNFNLG